MAFSLSALASLWTAPVFAQDAAAPKAVPLPRRAEPAPELPPFDDVAELEPPGPRRKQVEALAKRLEWRWPKFTFYQFGLSLGQGGLALAGLAVPGQSGWKGGNALDDPAREAFRIHDREASLYARDASDIGLVVLLNQQLVDTLFVTWWFHDKGSTALQMGLIDLQTISFSAGIQSFVAGIVGRERPYLPEICDTSPDKETSDCAGGNSTRSFFSGHATLAFTVAGLTCVHHINLPIYGGGPIEAVPCVGTMLIAGAVSYLRVASDQHYMSDVLAGAALGTLSGFAIPYLFHYGWSTTADESPVLKKAGLSGISLVPNPTGLSVGGLF